MNIINVVWSSTFETLHGRDAVTELKAVVRATQMSNERNKTIYYTDRGGGRPDAIIT